MRYPFSHTKFCSVFLKWKWKSANSKNSINQWGMDWDQFKDPVYYLCLAGTVVASDLFHKRLQVQKIFFFCNNCFIRFSELNENISGKLKWQVYLKHPLLLWLSWIDKKVGKESWCNLECHVLICFSQTQEYQYWYQLYISKNVSSFLLLMLVNVKLDVNWHKRILFQGWILALVGR